MEQILQQLNWIDWLILLILLGYVLAGVYRGFVMGTLDLVGMAVSLGAAAVLYRAAANILLHVAQVPRALALLGSFLAIVVVVQVVFSAGVNLLFQVSRPVRILLGPLSLVDRGLGAAPGIVKGAIFATLAILPFALFPMLPQVSAAIERSSLGSRLVVAVVDAAPGLESFLGRELNEGLSFLTPPQTEEGMQINFGPLGTLAPDPAAEQRMLEMVNQERARAGLGRLEMDPQLTQVARAHSREMFELGYFAHNSPVSGTPFDRMREADIRFVVAGENLAYAPNVQIAHEGLMNSPGHRANILRPEFRRVGIGVIKSDFRGSMFTQEFTN